MKFAPMKEILKLAEERNVAYGAYVTVSYEMARAAIEAGNETGTPVALYGYMHSLMTDLVIILKNRCETVQEKKSVWNGCIISVCRKIRLKNLQRTVPIQFRL